MAAVCNVQWITTTNALKNESDLLSGCQNKFVDAVVQFHCVISWSCLTQISVRLLSFTSYTHFWLKNSHRSLKSRIG